MVENQSTIKPGHSGTYNTNFGADGQIFGFVLLSWWQMARVELSIAWRSDVLKSRESGKLSFFVKTGQGLCNTVSDLFVVSISNSVRSLSF